MFHGPAPPSVLHLDQVADVQYVYRVYFLIFSTFLEQFKLLFSTQIGAALCSPTELFFILLPCNHRIVVIGVVCSLKRRKYSVDGHT